MNYYEKPITQIFTQCFKFQINLLTPSDLLGGSQYQPTKSQKTVKIHATFPKTFLKEYLISFLMIPRVIRFALVVL